MTIAALRRTVSYEMTGSLESPSIALEDLVLDHIAIERELRNLAPADEKALRLLAEGFRVGEIAALLGESVRAMKWRVARLMKQLPARDQNALLVEQGYCQKTSGLQLLACDQSGGR